MLSGKFNLDPFIRGREVYVDTENKLFIVTGQPTPLTGFPRDMEISPAAPPAQESRTYLGLIPFNTTTTADFNTLSAQAAPLDEKTSISMRTNWSEQRLEYTDEIMLTRTYAKFDMLDKDVATKLTAQRAAGIKFAR